MSDEVGDGQKCDLAMERSVEEDAFDTMLETSVVELDEALKLGGIANYTGTPQSSIDSANSEEEPIEGSVEPGRTKNLPDISAPPANDDSMSLPQAPLMEYEEANCPSGAKLAPMVVPLPPMFVTKDAATPEPRSGRWTIDEKILFLYGLQKYGRGKWRQIQSYCPGRCVALNSTK